MPAFFSLTVTPESAGPVTCASPLVEEFEDEHPDKAAKPKQNIPTRSTLFIIRFLYEAN